MTFVRPQSCWPLALLLFGAQIASLWPWISQMPSLALLFYLLAPRFPAKFRNASLFLSFKSVMHSSHNFSKRNSLNDLDPTRDSRQSGHWFILCRCCATSSSLHPRVIFSARRSEIWPCENTHCARWTLLWFSFWMRMWSSLYLYQWRSRMTLTFIAVTSNAPWGEVCRTTKYIDSHPVPIPLFPLPVPPFFGHVRHQG